jgi:hypothetical protein
MKLIETGSGTVWMFITRFGLACSISGTDLPKMHMSYATLSRCVEHTTQTPTEQLLQLKPTLLN